MSIHERLRKFHEESAGRVLEMGAGARWFYEATRDMGFGEGVFARKMVCDLRELLLPGEGVDVATARRQKLMDAVYGASAG